MKRDIFKSLRSLTANATGLSVKFFAITSTIGVTFLLQSCGQPNANPQLDNYMQLAEIAEFSPQSNYQVTRTYTGNIIAKQRTQLSFEYSGRIDRVNVYSGDDIKKDQVLASLDVELLNIKVRELNAQIEQVNAQIKLNKANLTRVSSLIANDYASEQRVDELNAEKAVLLANLEGIKASRASLEYQISRAQLKAPYDGVVFERLISEGDLVNAGAPTFTLINQHEQEIITGIPAKLARQLSINDTLPVEINDIEHQATIIAIGKQIDSTNRTVQIRLTLPEPLENISGLIAKVMIPQTIEQNGFWIPLTALTDGIRGQWNIYLVAPNPDGSSEITPQTVNVEHTTTSQAFISGINDQQLTIVQSGLHRYVPGQLVRTKAAKTAGQQ